MLEKKGVDPDTTAAMREQIDRAGRFVEDLLRYGRPRPLEVRRIDLAALVQLAHSTARQGLGPLAPEATLRFEGPNQLQIEADQAQLSQVFVVLFENAFLALGEAPRRELLVRLAGADGRAHVALEDSGPGVPEPLLSRLFQPFVSGRSRSSPRPGTGLGLATARTIVERHGGRISARRSSLGGACFEVELPLAQPVLAAATAAPPEEVIA
jgi:signal transduction histidine kinase